MTLAGRAAFVTCALVLALAPTASAKPPIPDDGPDGSRRCNAIVVDGTPTGQVRKITVVSGIHAMTHPRRYGGNAALWTSVRGIGCRSMLSLMASVLLARDELVALDAWGWDVSRIDRFKTDGIQVHQVWATQGRKRIIFVRRGDAPRVSTSVYRAAQNVVFKQSPTGVYGGPSACTAAYVLQLTNGPLVGLTAGHCSQHPRIAPSGTWETETAIRFRRSYPRFDYAEQPLGGVIANTLVQRHDPDALVFGLGDVGWAAQQIERGIRGNRTPFRVTGTLALRRQRKGQRVCFSGRTSGGEHCGRIYRTFEHTQLGALLICARVRTRPGDSGGPVYTPPRNGGVRAAGIVTASFSLEGFFFPKRGGNLCYTPIQRILAALGASLPTGSFAVPPPPSGP
jgi:hypothetical protein